MTTFNESDLFKNFQDMYKCGHNFRERFEDLSAKYYICQHGITEELRYGIINLTQMITPVLLLINIEL